MANLYKVSMFVLDVNEEYDNIEELIEDAFQRTEASAHFVEAEMSQFPWHDDIILNYFTATKKDFEDFMDIAKLRKKQMMETVENKRGEIKSSLKDFMKNLGLPTSDEDMIEFLTQVNNDAKFYLGEKGD